MAVTSHSHNHSHVPRSLQEQEESGSGNSDHAAHRGGVHMQGCGGCPIRSWTWLVHVEGSVPHCAVERCEMAPYLKMICSLTLDVLGEEIAAERAPGETMQVQGELAVRARAGVPHHHQQGLGFHVNAEVGSDCVWGTQPTVGFPCSSDSSGGVSSSPDGYSRVWIQSPGFRIYG